MFLLTLTLPIYILFSYFKDTFFKLQYKCNLYDFIDDNYQKK